MSAMDLPNIVWRKATRSTNNGACVEVGVWNKSSRSGQGTEACVEVGPCECCGVAVRDSKDPDGPKLTFDAAEWHAFTAHVRTGRLDLP
ncbi:DUF397 domain-containing protein [Actinomadura craniellae]|uniref:DUF397 domain-containing protein n=1 Tax=Actinomadura craniellae TaxID=2231787 RepID=A0A365H3A5_9ACTN|nr:DUF397 domain-containing protein [Actinomadura craniellae]